MSKVKRLIALVLLFITVTFNIAVAEVQAESVQNELVTDILVAAGAVIGSETALAYALGALGFTAASALIYENRDSLVDWCEDVKADFIDFCAKSKEWASVTGAKIQNWLEGIGTGVLDKADETWLALKDFCVDIYNKQKADVPTSNYGTINVGNLHDWFNGLDSNFFDSCRNIYFDFDEYDALTKGLVGDKEQPFKTIPVPYMGGYEVKAGDESRTEDFKIWSNDFTKRAAFRVYYQDGSYYYYIAEFSTLTKQKDFSTDNLRFYPWSFIEHGDNDTQLTINWGGLHTFFHFEDSLARVFSVPPSSIGETDKFFSDFYVFDGFQNVDAMNSYFPYALAYIATCYYHSIAIPGLDIPWDDGISEEKTQEYVVDGSIEDVIERDGTLDNVDVINPPNVYEEDKDKVFVDVEGITIEDIAKPFPDERTITIDNTGDVVLPDKKPVPKPVDNSDVKDYTLTGIQKVFPFCVPWDIKMLLNTLTADAQAPKFNWKFIYFDNKGKKEKKIELDLSVFDGAASILRKMELLAFIVGLVLLTRNIIKG